MSRLDANSFSTLILIVDALDECDDENDIRTIVQLLAEARSLERVRLRVFMISRPEIPIRYSFYRISESEYQDYALHDISPPIVDDDIAVFLNDSFANIARERRLDPGWPGKQTIGRLVQSASGLFIWP
jgi:hypothetical protein